MNQYMLYLFTMKALAYNNIYHLIASTAYSNIVQVAQRPGHSISKPSISTINDIREKCSDYEVTLPV